MYQKASCSTCINLHPWTYLYTPYDKNRFQTLLGNVDWDSYFLETNPNVTWDKIMDNIVKIINVMCPLKQIKIFLNKPYWLSHHMKESINERNKLYRDAKVSGDPTTLTSARGARNRTNKLINSAKEDFIKDSRETNKSDPKKFGV